MTDQSQTKTRSRRGRKPQRVPDAASTAAPTAVPTATPTPEEVPNRERSSAAQTKTQAQSEGLGGITDPRDPNKATRPPRVPMDKGQNLDVNRYQMDRANYYYRWITEKPHRPGSLAKAKAAYYEHCVDHEGNVISRPSGAGVTYLMRLPMKYRQEDLAAKKAKVEKTLQDEASLKPNEYAPTKTAPEGGESSIVERKVSDNPYAE